MTTVTEYGVQTHPGLHSTVPIPRTEEYRTDLIEAHHRVFDRL
ncbi:hypothetical protein [Saccharothrix deserti]|nr:hypothetical protein [Saccharothrix deserti]